MNKHPLIIILIAISFAGQVYADDVIHVSAANLAQAYDENSVVADTQYKDKPVVVTGEVFKAWKDADGSHVMFFVTLEGLYHYGKIFCYLSKDAALPDLKQGDIVQVTGICGGKTTAVMINNCSVKLIRSTATP